MSPMKAIPYHERIVVKKTNTLLAALLAGLLLSACEKAAEPVATEPEAGVPVAPLNPGLDPAQVARGRAVFDKHCMECHGANGRGQPGDWRVRNADGFYPPPPLDDTAHAWHHPTAALQESVREGSPQGLGLMPPMKHKLSEQEIADVVTYIKSLWSPPVYRQWLDIERRSLEP